MKPKVSLIFPVYGQAKLLEKALTTLKEVTVYENYEVILVDDCSQEDMSSVYEKKQELFDQLIRLPQNTGNSTIVVNKGLEYAGGEIIQYQNTDVYFTEPYWLNRLVENLDDKTGAIGSVLLYPDGSIQSAGFYYDRKGVNRHIGKFRRLEGIGKGSIEVPMVTGCGLTTWKKLLNEQGGFPVYKPYGWDDTDWCLRVRMQGYTVKLCRDSYFYHLGTVSYHGKVNKQYKNNNQLIYAKYRNLIEKDAMNRDPVQKALFYVKSFYLPMDSDDKKRLQDLLVKGYDITVFSFDGGEYVDDYRRLGCRAFVPLRSVRAKLLQEKSISWKFYQFLKNIAFFLIHVKDVREFRDFLVNERFSLCFCRRSVLLKLFIRFSASDCLCKRGDT